MEDGNSKISPPLRDFYIPDYMLVPESKKVDILEEPTCPVVVFINSRSGGQLGGDLIKTYRELLNHAQVFDLGEGAPDKVLHRLYGNIEKLKSEGDHLAAHIEKTLRLIVAGGDGTAGWLLGVVCDLKLAKPPPIATVPLGTGNNLPYSFGWGKKNPTTDQQSVLSFLQQVKEAKEMKIDRESTGSVNKHSSKNYELRAGHGAYHGHGSCWTRPMTPQQEPWVGRVLHFVHKPPPPPATTGRSPSGCLHLHLPSINDQLRSEKAPKRLL